MGQQAAAGFLLCEPMMGAFRPTILRSPAARSQALGVRRLLTYRLPNPLTRSDAVAGRRHPLHLARPSQFRADPPYELSSKRYAKEYNEVKALGALQGSTRTAEQTDLAYFYADNLILLWNRTLRGIASSYVNNNIGNSARLFAWPAWRARMHSSPLGIASITTSSGVQSPPFRKATMMATRGTAGDPTWQPLINTPNYPDHTQALTILLAP